MEKLIKITDLLVAISSLHSILDDALHRHSLKVAYIAALLGSQISYSNEILRNLTVASLFHDIGILFFRSSEQSKLLLKETKYSERENELIHAHAKIGFELFKYYPFFSKISRIIPSPQNLSGVQKQSQKNPLFFLDSLPGRQD